MNKAFGVNTSSTNDADVSHRSKHRHHLHARHSEHTRQYDICRVAGTNFLIFFLRANFYMSARYIHIGPTFVIDAVADVEIYIGDRLYTANDATVKQILRAQGTLRPDFINTRKEHARAYCRIISVTINVDTVAPGRTCAGRHEDSGDYAVRGVPSRFAGRDWQLRPGY